MASKPASAAGRIAKQIAMVIVVSYLGTIWGAGLYAVLWMYGFRFDMRAGHMAGLAFVFQVAVPIASALASVLVSRYMDHVRPSKLGALLSLVASFLGVCVGDVLLQETRVADGWLGQVLFFLWPAWAGVYAFLGYQAGLIATRGQQSRKVA